MEFMIDPREKDKSGCGKFSFPPPPNNRFLVKTRGNNSN